MLIVNTTSGLLSFDTHWEFKFPSFVCVATSNKQENIWLLLGVTNEAIFRSSDLQQQYIWKYNPFHFSSMYRNKVLWLMAWRNEDWRREQMDGWLPASSASVCAHFTRDFLLLYHLNPSNNILGLSCQKWWDLLVLLVSAFPTKQEDRGAEKGQNLGDEYEKAKIRLWAKQSCVRIKRAGENFT